MRIFFLSMMLVAQIFAVTCNDMANKINQNAPMRVDKITILTSSVCVNNNLVYLYQIENIDNETIKNHINSTSFKNKIKNSFCTLPDTKAILEILDGAYYKYLKDDGSYLGEIYIKKNDCLN